MGLSDRLRDNNISNTPKIVEEVAFSEFITDALYQKISTIPVWYDYDYSKQFELILNFLDSKLNNEFEDLKLTDSEKKSIAESFLKSDNGFGILDSLVAADDVVAVNVNSYGSVYVERKSGIEKTDVILSKKQFDDIALRLKCTSSVNRLRKGNFLITLLKPPVANNVLSIRKINDEYRTLNDFVSSGVLTLDLINFIKFLLSSKKNIIVAGKNPNLLGDFLQILINSIDESNRIVLLEDSGLYRTNLDNVSVFSTLAIKDFEYEYLLKLIAELNPDYTLSQLEDYDKLLRYYQTLDTNHKGLITQMKAVSASDLSNKLVNLGLSALKSTEKQAKLKASSIYDYIIFLEEDIEKTFVISSILEVSSTKTSALVLNEVVKFVEGLYVLDLPESFQDDYIEACADQTYNQNSFLARLKGV